MSQMSTGSYIWRQRDQRRTGTFFCVITTETPAPLIANEVCPEVVIALKAYSAGWTDERESKTLMSRD